MNENSTAIAYPGVPVVFAEGYRTVGDRRVSLHSHMSLALTSVNGSVRTETTARRTGSGVELTVNGKSIAGPRGEGMLKIVGEMLSRAGIDSGVKAESNNYGIITGSSDSGAAALAVALNDLLGLKLSESELCEIGRLGSETAYRSLLGGLSECSVSGEKASYHRIKSAEDLSTIAAYGVPFNIPRHSADELHLKVVGHPAYQKRADVVNGRIKKIKECVGRKDYSGMLEIMESDAGDVHRMFAEVGLPVIKPQMRKLCDTAESMRKRGIRCYWNVAGGSQVYLFTIKRYAEAVETELYDLGYKFTQLKVAGQAILK
jgi:mevalonate-3-kinase